MLSRSRAKFGYYRGFLIHIFCLLETVFPSDVPVIDENDPSGHARQSDIVFTKDVRISKRKDP